MNILVTGAKGFVGKNLVTALQQGEAGRILEFDTDNTPEELDYFLGEADVIFHLAGVNRPSSMEHFQIGNADFTVMLCRKLQEAGKRTKVIFSSSIQALLDNPYGVSKKQAEDTLLAYAEATGAEVVIYRLKNVFGKWCRPNYNSAVATFCYNISRDLPIIISNPENRVSLVYIDDVVQAFLGELAAQSSPGARFAEIEPSSDITLAELVALITSFKQIRSTHILPDFSKPLVPKLYATYLSYLEQGDFGYALEIRADARGTLAEFLKNPHIGQLFVSRTYPGITRGDHWHHTKVEKFMVVEGKGIIRFRPIHDGQLIEYPVDGERYQVVDIPPGYTHSIENVGDGVMVTIFWASEIFDHAHPDTFSLKVKP